MQSQNDSPLHVQTNATHFLGEVERVALSHGFTAPVLVTRIRSVRRLPIKAGVYVLGFTNGEYYVGQSRDVRKRILQHANRHSDLRWVCIKYVPKCRTLVFDLGQIERQVISKLEAHLAPMGIHTRGIAHVMQNAAPSAFDTIVPQEAQREFVSDPYFTPIDSTRSTLRSDPPQYWDRYQRLKAHKQWAGMHSVLTAYVNTILPSPNATEAHYWSVSCYPNSGLAVRMNVGWQTTMDVYCSARTMTFVFYLPISLIAKHLEIDHVSSYPDVPDPITVRDELGHEVSLRQEPIALTKGGANQVALSTDSATHALTFLAFPGTISALRQFALGLLRQGPNPSKNSHCVELATTLLHPLAIAPLASNTEPLRRSSPRSDNTAGPPLVSSPQEAVATLVGKYNLIERVSSGGQGEVWRAYTQEGIECAVKVMSRPKSRAEREEIYRRFDDEVKAGRLVHGNHICEMLDAGTCETLPELGLPHGVYYVVLEFVRGGTLLERYERSNQIEAHEVRSFCRAMVSALAAAHELPTPIIHRDIKPENVLLPDGDLARAKLVDFGISRATGDTQLTTVGGFAGTWVYMPPEQFAESWNVGPASDQYSLALLLWELVLDEVPGAKSTELGTRRARKKALKLEPFEFDGKQMRHLTKVFSRALSSDPEKRYPSIREFGDAFDEAGVKDRLWTVAV